jgi:PncC family amidohydrolase
MVDKQDEFEMLQSIADLGQQLMTLGWSLGVAESCTGGLLGHLLTNLPGSSDFFKGGIVAYSNDVKHTLLKVEDAILEQHGAVSQETALAMVRGARKTLDVELAAAITGIAGPGGGTKDKPVGTVWIAVSLPGGEKTKLFHIQGNRLQVKQQSAQAALEMLLSALPDST